MCQTNVVQAPIIQVAKASTAPIAQDPIDEANSD